MQLGLFANTADINWSNYFSYTADYFTAAEATEVMQHLSDSNDWQQPEIWVFGKWHKIPRLQCFIADYNLAYQYSGHRLVGKGWSKRVAEVRDGLNTHLASQFNSCLINRYRNGQDSMGWHADDEAELGCNPIVAIISLGSSRTIMFKHNSTGCTTSLNLEHGSLLLMKADMQSDCKHQIPKQVGQHGERISLTFRRIFTPY